MAQRRTKSESTTPVKALKHKGETRSNIPTAETEAFAAKAETRPVDLLYPRDPSLDPQLVWRGKDEQDREALRVPAVPIYIQETIEPQAIIEDLRSRTRAESDQPDLFGDAFSDLEFEERVDFYKHAGKWTNRMILGDSLMVMASLAEKEGLKGQVQMIYMDPPYGIKFGSNWQVSTRKAQIKDGGVADASRQPEQIRAFRDTWQLGVHSYLTYLRDRLVVSRDLLSESGSVFVQIGDENVHLVRSLLDEVFGAANFVAQIAFQKTGGFAQSSLPAITDYLIWYGKDAEQTTIRPLFKASHSPPLNDPNYVWLEAPDGSIVRMTPEQRRGEVALGPGMRVFRLAPLTSSGPSSSSQVFELNGRAFQPPQGSHWKTTVEGLRRLAAAGRVQVSGNLPQHRLYWDNFPAKKIDNVWLDTQSGGFNDAKVYVVQTTNKVLERCMLMTTAPGDLILDPTCGSGTAAVVAEEWGRRWITIDTSRVALALARTRVTSSKFPYYVLADTLEGARKEAEVTGVLPVVGAYTADLRKGFVYQRLPHVTLKSIANNPEIGEGMTRAEIDEAIARHAETEVLLDRPYQEDKVVRVAGPFTVESLSPHRVLVTGPEDEETAQDTASETAGGFVALVLENLRRAGVQNTYKEERLDFETLEPYPGVYVQAVGSYPEAGQPRIAAIAIGPEFGTVGKELIREAAKEAVAFGADVLIVAGFAFEALVEGEEKIGKLVVLKAKMNPDLQMPDLLKKTGAGNLFMVFGEPDIDVRTKDGEVTAEVRGLDVYDPTTGEVRSNSTEDIACWFIDTNYNGESFFVRHAYFTGADAPYEKLRKALKADIDEEAWASLNSTVSRPFKAPATGKVAVKVINHYGDEVLKVYEVETV